MKEKEIENWLSGLEKAYDNYENSQGTVKEAALSRLIGYVSTVGILKKYS